MWHGFNAAPPASRFGEKPAFYVSKAGGIPAGLLALGVLSMQPDRLRRRSGNPVSSARVRARANQHPSSSPHHAAADFQDYSQKTSYAIARSLLPRPMRLSNGAKGKVSRANKARRDLFALISMNASQSNDSGCCLITPEFWNPLCVRMVVGIDDHQRQWSC